MMTIEEFETRFLPLAAELMRRAERLTGNRQDAQDAVQEGYARLWHERGRLADMDDAEGYMAATVRNYCLNLLRRRREEVSDEALAALAAWEDNAEAQMEAESDRRLMRRLVGELPPKAAHIVTLSVYGEMGTADIARLTGLTEVNVRVTLHRSKKWLVRRFEEMTDDR